MNGGLQLTGKMKINLTYMIYINKIIYAMEVAKCILLFTELFTEWEMELCEEVLYEIKQLSKMEYKNCKT